MQDHALQIGARRPAQPGETEFHETTAEINDPHQHTNITTDDSTIGGAANEEKTPRHQVSFVVDQTMCPGLCKVQDGNDGRRKMEREVVGRKRWKPRRCRNQTKKEDDQGMPLCFAQSWYDKPATERSVVFDGQGVIPMAKGGVQWNHSSVSIDGTMSTQDGDADPQEVELEENSTCGVCRRGGSGGSGGSGGHGERRGTRFTLSTAFCNSRNGKTQSLVHPPTWFETS